MSTSSAVELSSVMAWIETVWSGCFLLGESGPALRWPAISYRLEIQYLTSSNKHSN